MVAAKNCSVHQDWGERSMGPGKDQGPFMPSAEGALINLQLLIAVETPV